jgi:uncharacterized protein involved in exopolysaccharide biosynthesis
MSSASAKTAQEVTRPLDLDQLLAKQFHQDQSGKRERKIQRLSQLWDRRKWLAKISASGAAAALVLALLIPSRYASITRLMPPDPAAGQGMAMLAGLVGKMGLGTIGTELLGMTTSGELFAGVLQSTSVQNELIEKFDLRRVYGERRLADTRKELSRQTDISIDRKSGIISVQVTDHDPKRAQALAQEYVAQLNSVVTQLNTSSAHRERVFLEGRLAEVKDELESAEKDFSQFSSKNAALDIKEQGKAMVESAAILEGQLIAAQTELQGLRQIFTDQNIRVQATQARINELRRQIQKMGGATDGAATDTNKEEELYPSIRKLPLLGVTYADLYRRMKVEETVFETLTQQYEISKFQEAKEVPSVKVLDPPEIPEKKVFPPRTLLTLLGGVLAFLIGAASIIANDHWASIDPQDPGKILVLNMVESVRPQLNYIVQTRNSVAKQARKSVDRLRGEASPPLEEGQ